MKTNTSHNYYEKDTRNQKYIKTEFGNASLRDTGYYRITSRKEGNHGKDLHKVIWESFYGMTIPKGYNIHHINGCKTDNRIQNLQCVDASLHSKYHHQLNNLAQYGYLNPSLDTKIKMSKNQNSSGYFRVVIRNRGGIDYYEYHYYEDGKRKSITRKTIELLKNEVLKRDLEWIEYNAC